MIMYQKDEKFPVLDYFHKLGTSTSSKVTEFLKYIQIYHFITEEMSNCPQNIFNNVNQQKVCLNLNILIFQEVSAYGFQLNKSQLSAKLGNIHLYLAENS